MDRMEDKVQVLPPTLSPPILPDQVSIIGRDQVTTDIPEHSYMKLAKGAAASGGGREDETYVPLRRP